MTKSSCTIPRFGFYQNCRGLRTKLSTLKCNVLCFDYLFLIFTETWLNSSINSCELGLTNYCIYRCDRSPLTSSCERGGGVLIAIHRDIPSFLHSPPFQPVEQLFVGFSLGSLNFIIGGVYLPPSSTDDSYSAHLSSVDHLLLKYPSYLFLFGGDYNLPDISWSNDRHGLCYSTTSANSNLSVPECFSLHGFYQLNNIPNSHGS
jgi:hypothetical protein